MATILLWQCDICDQIYDDEAIMNTFELNINEFACVSTRIKRDICQTCFDAGKFKEELDALFTVLKATDRELAQ